jgi:protein AroM
MKKLGILTIGQSPRPDILGELLPLFDNDIEIFEAGALDGLTMEEIREMKPGSDDRLLVTRLATGSVVRVSEEALMGCMQEKIRQLEAKGTGCIFIFCTARFQGLSSRVPLIQPGEILNETIPKRSKHLAIGVLSPEAEQVSATRRDWHGIVERLEVLTASPYGPLTEIEMSARAFGKMDVDLIVLDCMGYTEEIRERMEVLSGKPVILSKTLAAEKAVEILRTI